MWNMLSILIVIRCYTVSKMSEMPAMGEHLLESWHYKWKHRERWQYKRFQPWRWHSRCRSLARKNVINMCSLGNNVETVNTGTRYNTSLSTVVDNADVARLHESAGTLASEIAERVTARVCHGTLLGGLGTSLTKHR